MLAAATEQCQRPPTCRTSSSASKPDRKRPSRAIATSPWWLREAQPSCRTGRPHPQSGPTWPQLLSGYAASDAISPRRTQRAETDRKARPTESFAWAVGLTVRPTAAPKAQPQRLQRQRQRLRAQSKQSKSGLQRCLETLTVRSPMSAVSPVSSGTSTSARSSRLPGEKGPIDGSYIEP